MGEIQLLEGAAIKIPIQQQRGGWLPRKHLKSRELIQTKEKDKAGIWNQRNSTNGNQSMPQEIGTPYITGDLGRCGSTEWALVWGQKSMQRGSDKNRVQLQVAGHGNEAQAEVPDQEHKVRQNRKAINWILLS